MTVSNVLNNRSVAAATRSQVLEAMRELNYQPSAIARGLNRKPMDTLGIVLPNAFESPVSHPYYGPILDGITNAAVARHKHVMIFTGSLWTQDGDGMQRYRDGRVDGLIVLGPMSLVGLLRELSATTIPFVGIGQYWANEKKINCVRIDDVMSSMVLVNHLTDLGHRRISFFTGFDTISPECPRHLGYQRALSEVGIDVDPLLQQAGGWRPRGAREYAEKLAADRMMCPTAVVAFNDELALNFISELEAVGFSVPEDISVVGHDDIKGASKAGLTTMRQPIRAMGARAARMLLDVLSGEIVEAQTELFETELIVRSSSAPPRRSR